MPERETNKIEISPRARQALAIEAAVKKMRLKDLASEMILQCVKPETLKFLDSQTPKGDYSESPKPHKSVHSDLDQDKPKIVDSPDAIEKIKNLWASGERNTAEIARQIGYHRKTTYDNIQRMRERGELQESPSEAQTD